MVEQAWCGGDELDVSGSITIVGTSGDTGAQEPGRPALVMRNLAVVMSWDTGMVVFVTDDLGAWLISLLADAGRKKLTAVLFGPDQERALRSAATAAVRLTASQLRESDDQHAEQVGLVISQVFSEPLPGSSIARYDTMLEALQAGIADQLAVLDDASLTGTGRSSADVLGVSAGVLAEELTGQLVREIVARGSRGGPLSPLADQLNHDVTHLQGRQTHDAVRELGRAIRETLVSAGLSRENVVPSKDPDFLARSCLVLPNGRLPQVQQVNDPVTLGVHPSSRLSGFASPTGEPVDERVPPYVPRDVDDELRTQLADSRFVMVVGDSSAGKSRAAFEAVSTLGDHLLVVPRNREALTVAVDQAARTRRCILWLDDIEKYLGPGGLSPADVARVLAGTRPHRVIVATLRSAEESLLTDEVGGDEGGRQASRGAREVLELAYRVQLPRLFSRSEITRAESRAWDPRIADAVAQASEYGIAEYLAAGPELMRDWENAWSPNTDPRVPSHPRAAALITAAVDIRRSGFTSPLPRDLLTQVHDHYLQERGGSRLRPEPIAEAWAWATKARRATTALLQDVDGEHVRVFDYLLDSVQRRNRPGDYAPDGVLAAALAVCAPFDADKMAAAAYSHGRYEFAETAWLSAYHSLARTLGAEHPDTLAVFESHANVLRELGRPDEGETELRSIAEVGTRVLGPEHPQVLSARNSRALALIRLGRSAEAEEELRAVNDISSRVVGPEHDVTMTSRHLHAISLHNLGRLAEAEAENRSVLAAWTQEWGPEDPSTLYSRGNLASILYDTGRREEAEAEARAVLDIRSLVFGPEHPNTLHIRAFRANVLRELGRPDEAESEHRAIVEMGKRVLGPEHPRVLSARNARAFALIRLGRAAEAEEELRAVQEVSSRVLGPEHDVTMTSRHFRAIALHNLGRLAEAEAENRSVLTASTRDYGPEAVNTLYSRGNLARVLNDAGRREEAENEARAVLDIRTRVYGPKHPDTQHIQSFLAQIETESHRGSGEKIPTSASGELPSDGSTGPA